MNTPPSGRVPISTSTSTSGTQSTSTGSSPATPSVIGVSPAALHAYQNAPITTASAGPSQTVSVSPATSQPPPSTSIIASVNRHLPNPLFVTASSSGLQQNVQSIASSQRPVISVPAGSIGLQQNVQPTSSSQGPVISVSASSSGLQQNLQSIASSQGPVISVHTGSLGLQQNVQSTSSSQGPVISVSASSSGLQQNVQSIPSSQGPVIGVPASSSGLQHNVQSIHSHQGPVLGVPANSSGLQHPVQSIHTNQGPVIGVHAISSGLQPNVQSFPSSQGPIYNVPVLSRGLQQNVQSHQQNLGSAINIPVSSNSWQSNITSNQGSSAMDRQLAEDRFELMTTNLQFCFVTQLPAGDVLAKNETRRPAILIQISRQMQQALDTVNHNLNDFSYLQFHAAYVWTEVIRRELQSMQSSLTNALPFNPATFKNTWTILRKALNTLSPEFLPHEYKVVLEEETITNFSIPDPLDRGTFIPSDYEQIGLGPPILNRQPLDKYIKAKFTGPQFTGEDSSYSFISFWKKFSSIHQSPLLEISIHDKHESLFRLISGEALDQIKSFRDDPDASAYRTVIGTLCTMYGNPATQGSRLRAKLSTLVPQSTSIADTQKYVNEVIQHMNCLIQIGKSKTSAATSAWEQIEKKVKASFLRDFESAYKITPEGDDEASNYDKIMKLRKFILRAHGRSRLQESDESAHVFVSTQKRPGERRQRMAPFKKQNISSNEQLESDTDSQEHLLSQAQDNEHRTLLNQYQAAQHLRDLKAQAAHYQQKHPPNDLISPYSSNNPVNYSHHQQTHPPSQQPPVPQASSAPPPQDSSKMKSTKTQGCFICKDPNHRVHRCTVPRHKRFQMVKDSKKCTCCLSEEHTTNDCTVTRFDCNNCKQAGKDYRHNYLLCKINYRKENQQRKPQESDNTRTDSSQCSPSLTPQNQQQLQQLMQQAMMANNPHMFQSSNMPFPFHFPNPMFNVPGFPQGNPAQSAVHSAPTAPAVQNVRSAPTQQSSSQSPQFGTPNPAFAQFLMQNMPQNQPPATSNPPPDQDTQQKMMQLCTKMQETMEQFTIGK